MPGPLPTLSAGMCHDISLPVDNTGLPIHEVVVIRLDHVHHGARREPLCEQIERARIMRAQVHGLRFADADIRPNTLVAATASQGKSRGANTQTTCARAARDD